MLNKSFIQKYNKLITILLLVVFIIGVGYFKDSISPNQLKSVKGEQTINASFFEKNRQNYINYCSSQEAINKAGSKEESGKCSWAWLKQNRIDLLEKELKEYYLQPDSGELWWVVGTDYRPAQVMYFWIKAKDKLSEDLTRLLKNKVRDFHEQSISKNPNGAFQIMVAEYLYTEFFNRNLLYNCRSGNKWCVFNYNNHSYKTGKTYNTYQLSKDFLEKEIDDMVKQGKRSRIFAEIDSPSYTWSFLNGLLMLHETTKDKQLKNKARMALDMLFLDTGTQCIFKQGQNTLCSSPLGRNYPNLIGNRFYFPFKQYLKQDDSFRNWPPFNSLYVSEYYLPSVIFDVLDKSNEPENYIDFIEQSHFRSNDGPIKSSGQGAVSSDWAIGAKLIAGHSLVISGDYNPIMIFINDDRKINNGGRYAWTNLGKNSVAYKNAIYTSSPYKVYANFLIKTHNVFDKGQENLKKVDYSVCNEYTNKYHNVCADYTLRNRDKWNYFLKGKTAIAIRTNYNNGAIEVATICPDCDYKTFDEFKSAQRVIQGNCFITGLGDKLCRKYNSTQKYYYPEINNHFSISDFPLNRLSIKNNNGEKVVSWKNNVMTVFKHGKQCVYNFNNWTVSGNGCGKQYIGPVVPPSPITPTTTTTTQAINIKPILKTVTQGETALYGLTINSTTTPKALEVENCPSSNSCSVNLAPCSLNDLDFICGILSIPTNHISPGTYSDISISKTLEGLIYESNKITLNVSSPECQIDADCSKIECPNDGCVGKKYYNYPDAIDTKCSNGKCVTTEDCDSLAEKKCNTLLCGADCDSGENCNFETCLCNNNYSPDGNGSCALNTSNQLPTVSNLKQFDGNKEISEATTINDAPHFVFTISDPDNEDTVGYQIQLSPDSSFTNLIVDYTLEDLTTSPNTFTYQITNNLPDGTYFWRVRAKDSNNAFSDWKTFGSQNYDFEIKTTPDLTYPTADFVACRKNQYTVKFTNASKDSNGNALGGNNAYYAWDFDNSDGITLDSSEENPTHQYASLTFKQTENLFLAKVNKFFNKLWLSLKQLTDKLLPRKPKKPIKKVLGSSSMRFYSLKGDGFAYFGNPKWTVAHNGKVGFSSPFQGGKIWGPYSLEVRRSNNYMIGRTFLPFDTSGLPDNATIDSVSLNFYVYQKTIEDNDSQAYIAVVPTSQASPFELTKEDYSRCEASNIFYKKPLKEISGSLQQWELDGNINNYISKTGITLLGLREGHDIENRAIDKDKKNQLVIRSSESSQKPYLEITYHVGPNNVYTVSLKITDKRINLSNTKTKEIKISELPLCE